MMTEEQAKSLLLKQENVYTRDPQLREPAFAYCEGYKAYLNDSRTEREAVTNAIRLAEREGFVEYKPGMSLKAGDKVKIICNVEGHDPVLYPIAVGNTGKNHADGKKFIDFVVSKEGQDILHKYGFSPVKK